uniref:Retrotransposon Copia-like N-terminal domain-containing protein n=1 Tax=Manihot esculenta TaxID=3983 RepID=A0A2C9U4P3_MANES
MMSWQLKFYLYKYLTFVESSDTDLITSKFEIDLLNSDSPSQILVSTPLTEFNYLSWNRSMIIALTAKDKIGFINGTCKKPSADSPLLPKWNRANNMVISWILSCQLII